jgi:acyl transferase domain-containing protein
VAQPSYWRRNMREPVNFRQAIQAATEEGVTTFLEIGPSPTLLALGRQCLSDPRLGWLPSLRRGYDEWQVILESVASLYTAGAAVNWKRFEKESSGRRVSLPTYPFERSRFWIEIPQNRDGVKQLDRLMVNTQRVNRADRKEQIISTLRPLIARFLELKPEQVHVDTPFLEMGADSLVLIEAVQAIEKIYGVHLSIRDFFESLTTLNALAAYLDHCLPVEDHATTEQNGPHPAHVDAGAMTKTATERLMEQQLNTLSQVISQQLAVLGRSKTEELPLRSPALSALTDRLDAEPAQNTQPPVEKPYVPYQKIQREAGGGLTERQRAHLASLTDRYTARTQRSKEKTQADRAVLADNRASAGFRLSIK